MPKLDWKNVRDIMASFHNQGPLSQSARAAGAAAGQNFPLSGPAGPSRYTPAPPPNVPYMPAAQVGPQMIPRGGNLGMPSSAPAIDPRMLMSGMPGLDQRMRGLFPGVGPARVVSQGLPMTAGARSVPMPGGYSPMNLGFPRMMN